MTTDPLLSFDPIRILRQLGADGVEYVLIGGMAGRIHGCPTVTNDLDICYRRSRANCERLAETLRKLGARLRDFPPELPSRIDAGTTLRVVPALPPLERQHHVHAVARVVRL